MKQKQQITFFVSSCLMSFLSYILSYPFSSVASFLPSLLPCCLFPNMVCVLPSFIYSFIPSFLHSSSLFFWFAWFFDELWSTPPTCHAWLTNHHGYCASASVATSSTRLQQSLRVAGEMIQWHAWCRLNFSNSNGKPKLGLCGNLERTERTERWRLWWLVGSQTLMPKEMRS